MYRTSAKVPYPNAYASASEAKDDRAKYLFNCAQRSQANFLEHQPVFLTGLLIGGLKYPIVSAGLGIAWCVARVMYALGYTSNRGRSIGTWFWGPELGEIGEAVQTGIGGNADPLHRTSHLLWADRMESVDWPVDGALGSLGRAIGLQV